MPNDTLTEKTCAKCGETKPRDDFSKNKTKPDGLQTWCRPCMLVASITAQRKKPEHYRAKVQKYRDDRPGFVTWCNGRLRARKAGVATTEAFTPELSRLITAIHASPCANCGSRWRVELDHIIPISKGGPDLPDNWQPLCRSCNAAKGDHWRVA